jgi:hypothetical protein
VRLDHYDGEEEAEVMDKRLARDVALGVAYVLFLYLIVWAAMGGAG